ncbi:DNA primase family protein [Maritimibacter alexandrii]|uniref:DNA primase family protein n=1 Tax=Maritimibacter alexandrii TaxID=2570355 RepID=UPI0011094911|nr:DNA primase family protein [Maritimibacter alexandrii]
MSTEDVRRALSSPERVTPMEGGAPPRTPGDGEPPESDEPIDPIYAASQQTENDVGNGQRFVIHFGDDLMYVPRVGWFTWTGTVWAADPDELEVRRRAQKIGALILEELDHIRLPEPEMRLIADEPQIAGQRDALALKSEPTDEERLELAEAKMKLTRIEALKKRRRDLHNRRRTLARNAGNSGPIRNMIGESQTALAVPLDALDAEPFEVNCLSGVLRSTVREEAADDGRVFRYAGIELVPHAREQRLTKIMPVEFREGATAPRFDAFLDRIMPDHANRAFLQRWFGVSMTAEPLQNMVFLYGSGANGKSVLVDVLSRILGDYAATARIESLTGTNRRGGGEATPDLIPLIGARLVRTSEPEEGAKLQEGLIKELTGGEPIMVRALHSDFIEVHPRFKMTMSGNHKPDIRGTDDGIWRRFLMVPFDEQIPEHERDPHLVEKLWEERDGIFQWLVAGLNQFREIGLAPPEKVVAATAEFRADQDPTGDFLTSCTIVTGRPEDSLSSARLGEAFTFWLIQNAHGAWKARTVSRRLSDKAERWRHPNGGQTFTKRKASTVFYDGIRLTDTFKRELDNAPRDHRGQFLAGDVATPDPASADPREEWED